MWWLKYYHRIYSISGWVSSLSGICDWGSAELTKPFPSSALGLPQPSPGWEDKGENLEWIWSAEGSQQSALEVLQGIFGTFLSHADQLSFQTTFQHCRHVS